MTNIAKKIAELRESRHWSQAEFAERINMSRQIVSFYESGRRRPSYEALEAIADAFNVPMSTFLDQKEQAEAPQDYYAQMGVAAHVDVSIAQSRPVPTIEGIIKQLEVLKQALSVTKSDEEIINMLHMLTPKQQAKIRKIMEVMLEDE